ncbi:NADP-dependent glutamate dehydrogenase [Tilletia horrida]|nr:NADP-dependent glutamate dehydrogenase [Tilletia horrida]
MSNYPHEPEFEQAVGEVTGTLATFLKHNPEYQKALDIIQIPERIITFRVVWEDDKGVCHVNRGYRVQLNSALGPYKGGLRFHPSVNLSILNLGAGKGGADFDPKGKSDAELRRFTKSFATELQRHIGPDTDVPAGDIGFTGREAGIFFGTAKQLRNEWSGIITGKGADFGGSFIRPESTGYGLVYYVEAMINYVEGKSEGAFQGKKVAISGSGNVAQFAALKVMEKGGIVVSLSDSKGTMLAKDTSKGFNKEHIEKILELKTARKELSTLGDDGGALAFHGDGARPWELVEEYDVALPCATQNEMNAKEAEAAVSRGAKYVAEGSNMGLEQAAIEVLEKTRLSKGKSGGTWYGPGKASNLGGVAVSGLEMAQNSQRLQWTPEEVDEKLKAIMKASFDNCFKTGKAFPPENDKYAEELPSLVTGANVAGFKKVADAMRAQGDWW